MDPVDELTQPSARKPRERYAKVKSVVKPFGYSPRLLDMAAKHRPLIILSFTAGFVGASLGYSRQEATGRICPKWVASLSGSEYILREEALTGPEPIQVTVQRWNSAVKDLLQSFQTPPR